MKSRRQEEMVAHGADYKDRFVRNLRQNCGIVISPILPRTSDSLFSRGGKPYMPNQVRRIYLRVAEAERSEA